MDELDDFLSTLEDELYEVEVDNKVFVAELFNTINFEEE